MVGEAAVPILQGAASVIVSAAAVGTYRKVSHWVELTEQNRRDLRGAEPNDQGLVHWVREHRETLRRHDLLGTYRGGARDDDREEDPAA